MIDVRHAIDDYLRLRRALGFKLRQHETALRDFARYLDRQGGPGMTTELAVAWATAPEHAHPYTWKRRLSIIRGFARYLQSLDPDTDVPSADHLAARYQRPIPFIYTQDEIRALIRAAGELTPEFRAITYQTLLGLLASTGMRVGEALRLNRADVDVHAQHLTIRSTKFGKSRIVPLHATVMEALVAYGGRRGEYMTRWPITDSFFVSIRGTRLLDPPVHRTFRRLVTGVGLSPRAGSGIPRIHDLRHSFTVATLRDWYATGQPVASQLPLLSAYLGHVNPVSTYWYLQTDPTLLRLAMERADRIPTVRP